MKYQKGLALSSLVYWGIAIGIVAMLGMKVLPSVIEYQKTLSAIKRTVETVPKDATVPEIRTAYFKYANIDQLELTERDLDITKEGGGIVISFEYDKKIHLFGPASLLMEYRGSSKPE